MGRIARIIRAAVAAALVAIPVASLPAPAAASEVVGHVYIQTNAVSGNAVVSFARAADGALTLEETVATDGDGTGTGLGSQAPLAITADSAHLLVVNAGSDDVSLFDVTTDGLVLADVQEVGDRPVSIDVHGDLAFVVNQGSDTIQGIRITEEGTLAKVPHSTRPVSGTGTGAAQVAFSPDGRVLAVTEKATNVIDTYTVRANGRAAGPNVFASAGAVPFGFDFGTDGRLYVSEAPGSAASSYDVDADGGLTTISASVANGQIAACWLAVTSDARFAYTANAGSANVSQYAIGGDGSLTLVGDGASGATDPGPVDLDVTEGDGFLYVLNGRSGSITGFAIDQATGALTGAGGASGFGSGATGLVAV
jgi:6-phosphogluconolactonase (cycloisomerase 2 family)